MAKLGKTGAAAKAVIGDKREAILRAAIKVFARKGFFNAKVADVAKEAGIADGTVSVDGREIYTAKGLRVGLFSRTDNF